MTVRELRNEFADVFDEESRSGNKQWLIKRIAWRMQANSFGGLSDRARQRAAEIANDADLRMKAPATPIVDDIPGMPNGGNVITRDYKGDKIIVTREHDGQFKWNGRFYRTLSAVAHAVTGSHTSGPKFFGLQKKGAKS